MSYDQTIYRAAVTELQAGRLAAAAELFRKVLETAPNHSESLEKLAVVTFQLDDAATAEAMLRKALTLNPKNPSGWNNLGVITEGLGRFAEAEGCYRQAIELAPAHGALHFNRANTLRSLGRWDEAEASFRQCIALDTSHAEARHNLGVLLKERGERNEAERYFRQTIELAPGMVDAHVNLGSTLQALGRDEEALAAYQEALRLHPGYPDAAAGEINVLDRLGRVEEAEARILPFTEQAANNPDVIVTLANMARERVKKEKAVTALEGLLARKDLSASKREAALFTLGKLYDSCGRFAEAFSTYQAANSARPHHFNLSEFRNYCDRIKKVLTRDLLEHLPRSRNQSPLPIFVVGMPRSGTSLVEQILASHPAVFGAGELTWLNQLSESLPQRLGACSNYPECTVNLSVRTLDDLAEEYFSFVLSHSSNAERFVDKMPGNFLHLGFIQLLFPGARIVHIRREPLDNCLSCYFQNFTQGHEYTADLGTLGAVYREYEGVMAHWHVSLTHPLLEVCYEDLVAHQERESRRLVEFCGLPWDERCLRFHETKRVVRTASYDQVRQPLYSGSVARHRNYAEFLGALQDALTA